MSQEERSVVSRIMHFEKTIEDLEKKVKELEGRILKGWETSCKIGSSTIRILDEEKLVAAFGLLLEKKAAFEKAKSILEADEKLEFIYEGFSYEKWESDFRVAMARLRIKSYKSSIAKLKSITEAYTPEELRRDKAFDAMEAEMERLAKSIK